MSIQADRMIAVRTGKTVYRDGETVLKVFDSDYSKADILNEALNQARIEETGLNIPKILRFRALCFFCIAFYDFTKHHRTPPFD